MALESGGAWANHPATLMWKGYEYDLAYYGCCICQEWIRRGYEDNMYPYFSNKMREYIKIINPLPEWYGDSRIHDSHCRRLIAKGEIDRIRWRIKKIDEKPDSFCRSVVGRDCRDLKVIDFDVVNDELEILGAPIAEPNHYTRLAVEPPYMSDKVEWPNVRN